MWELLEEAKKKDILVILDTKIGNIMRTQSQYAEKYKHFDAVTAHGYMGGDSIFPITDAMLGCYVLVFTSNPTRVDFETKSIMNESSLDQYVKLLDSGLTKKEASNKVLKESKKLYMAAAEKVVEWQFAGSVGAVIGGTPNNEGKLAELEEIVEYFGKALNYLPSILIPGVGTQGGSATDVTNAIVYVLRKLGWDKDKIRYEMRKVVINSASAIDYSPRPKDVAQDLVDEVAKALNDALM